MRRKTRESAMMQSSILQPRTASMKQNRTSDLNLMERRSNKNSDAVDTRCPLLVVKLDERQDSLLVLREERKLRELLQRLPIMHLLQLSCQNVQDNERIYNLFMRFRLAFAALIEPRI